jgi:hypothetical protein
MHNRSLGLINQEPAYYVILSKELIPCPENYELVSILNQRRQIKGADLGIKHGNYQSSYSCCGLVCYFSIPGVSEATAAVLIADIGVDMNQFPSAEHL